MSTLSRGITRALAGGLLTALVATASQPAAAAAGDVSVEIDLTGGVTILYYQSTLKVAIDTTGFLTAASPCTSVTTPATYFDCPTSAAANLTATVTGGTGLVVSGNAGPSTTAGTTGLGLSLTAVPLVLNNVWAVRALGGSTTSTTVQAALTANKTLSATAPGGTIVINGIDIGTGTLATPPASAPATTTKTVTFADPGLSSTQPGYVTLNVDLSNAKAASSGGSAYTGTGAQYVISITST